MGTSRRSKRAPMVAKEAATNYGKETPVYFLKVEIENVRCFGPKGTLELTTGDGIPAKWTIILGDNGAGKSTLLQCLAGMEPIPRPKPIEKLSEDDDLWPKFLLRPDWNQGLKRSGTSAGGVRVEFSRGAALSALPLGGTPVVKGWYTVSTPAGSYSPLPSIFSELKCYAYGAARRPGPGTVSEPKEKLRCASLFDENADLISPEEWMVQADYRDLKKLPLAHNQLERVKRVLIPLLPGISDIRIPSPGGLREPPRVEFLTPYGWVEFKRLGLGYRSMIAWVVDFAARLFDRYPDSPNPLAEPAVCLVDEIDLHMHPSWQRTLLTYLSERFPNTQFIATAHSPLVVQAAEDANIVVLRREGDHVVIENNVEAVKGWRVDQILTSELFGLPSARPPKFEEIQHRRVELLSKQKLAPKEKKELEALNKRIDALPSGETPAEREAMDIIMRAAAELKQKENGGDSSSKARTGAKGASNKRPGKARQALRRV